MSITTDTLASPPPQSFSLKGACFTVFIHGIATIGVVPFFLYWSFTRFGDVNDILSKGRRKNVKDIEHYKDEKLIEKLMETPVMKAYIAGGLEYQQREGFCANATIRCVLKSIPQLPSSNIPPVQGGPSVPKIVSANLDKAGDGLIRTSITYGDAGYEAFLEAMKKSNDVRYRVAVNFLRSPLFSYKFPWFVPFHFLLGLFGGHFSPVVGYLEEEDLVAIFDVNHSYEGVYFIESKRLFDAVNTADLTIQPRTTRGVVVTEILDCIKDDDKFPVKE